MKNIETYKNPSINKRGYKFIEKNTTLNPEYHRHSFYEIFYPAKNKNVGRPARKDLSPVNAVWAWAVHRLRESKSNKQKNAAQCVIEKFSSD